MNNLKNKFNQVEGGVPVIATACKVSPRAVYKWIDRGKLPRTEYSGETAYANTIANLPGADFSANQLLYPEQQAA